MENTRRSVGNVVAPWRFLVFVGVAFGVGGVLLTVAEWREAIMLGFDGGALLFMILCVPLFSHEADEMRRQAKSNDANRAGLLGITAIVSVAIMVAVASELMQKGGREPLAIALVLATLCLSWLFSTLVYTLHYAHLYYTADKEEKDSGGLDIPETKEPDYWDFLYFASCLGMTFQTSDVDITGRGIRHTVTFHCLAAFVFNLGVIAFSINVLGGGG